MISLFLQASVADTAQNVLEEHSIPVIDLVIKGGLLMIPIAILLLIGLLIFFERYFAIKRASGVDQNFMNSIRNYVKGGQLEAAKMLCAQTDSPTSRMVEKGLSRIGKPLKNIEVAIENVGKLELFKLEKRLGGLATISGAAPMIGFLGTVIGMIGAFFRLANNADAANPTALLANDIYVALVTTAGGLVVGIIAFVAYNYLVGLIEKVVHRMESTSLEFIDLLHEPAS